MAEDVVKSVGRVFEVLELFSTAKEPLNATQVERRLDYPQSSTLALLKSLVKLGYLAFDRIERTYFPTMRIAYLGEWLESSLYGNAAVSALMEDLCERTGETVVLSCQNDLRMQFLRLIHGRRPLTLNIQPGESAPLFRSTIGLAALSVQADEDIAKLAARHNRRASGGERIDLADLMKQINEIRVLGHGVSLATYVEGVGVLAWVLPNGSGPRPLILSVAAPSESIRGEVDGIVRAVKTAFRVHLAGASPQSAKHGG